MTRVAPSGPLERAARCRCGHAKEDHQSSPRWRTGRWRGIWSGPCGLCACQEFHKPGISKRRSS